MTFIEFLQSNGYDVDGDGNIVLEGTTDVQHQNVFSTQLEAWLASEHVFGSDAFAEWFEDTLDELVTEGDLDEADRDAILELFATGDYSIKLNQNSEEGAPYIEFAGYEFLTGLLGFESLFANSASHTWTQGRAEQTRYYFNEFVLGGSEVEITFVPTVAGGNEFDPLGHFLTPDNGTEFVYSASIYKFDAGEPDGLGDLVADGTITVDADGNLIIDNDEYELGTYKVLVTATPEGGGSATTATFTLLLGGAGTQTMPDGTYVLDPNGNNIMAGFAGADSLTGSDGVDWYLGGTQNDTFFSSGGGDFILPGNGSDTLVYTDVSHSTPEAFDTIISFSSTGGQQDKFDLSAIDANVNVAGNQDFVFVAVENENVIANSITWHYDSDNDRTIIQGDVTGDTDTDLYIVLLGQHTLTASHFDGVA